MSDSAPTKPVAPGQRVLLVDDDTSLLRNYRWCLEDEHFQVSAASTAEMALRLADSQVFDLCFLDVMLGEDSGLDLLPRLKAIAPWLRVVMATGESDIETAVTAMQRGAADYLVKPIAPEQLALAAHRHAEARRLELRIEQLEDQTRERDGDGGHDLDSGSAAMMAVLSMAQQVAGTDATVLILGESGTGKGVLAKAIHQWSARKERPLVTINSPSLSAELLESELFGHVKGAFTGATDHRQGRVQVADGGTLFLDEIGDFALPLQPKLLRFIQDREYERVGDPQTRTADVRIVAATNRPLDQMVADGRFREDLLYRINVITLELPPLRERREDIPGLAQRFLLQFTRSYRRPARQFSAEAAELLQAYPWPGNIRELRNVIERLAILCPAEVVLPEHLPASISGRQRAAESSARVGGLVSLEVLERAHIEAILASSATLDAAAQTLGIDSSTLYRKRKQYGL